MRRVCMQWTLAFLEVLPPARQARDQHLDDEVLGEALSILVRMLAQFSEAATHDTQVGAADE
jgi:hypothetical protein